MVYGNTAVIFMVIGVVAVVLALVFTGVYLLNRSVNQNGG